VETSPTLHVPDLRGLSLYKLLLVCRSLVYGSPDVGVIHFFHNLITSYYLSQIKADIDFARAHSIQSLHTALRSVLPESKSYTHQLLHGQGSDLL